MQGYMRCTAYCTAASYSIPNLFSYLQKEHPLTSYKDLIHMPHFRSDGTTGDAFYFNYGTVVFWGLTFEEEQNLLLQIKKFETAPLAVYEFDELTYSYGAPFKIHQDEITLPTPSPMTKLAISFGMAQSAKLRVFENSIRSTIEKTRSLPENLYKKGTISLSHKEIRKKSGELFIERNSINLHTDILDTPEFFWEYCELETFYRSTVNYLDIAKRVDVLNKRLDIVKELLEMLSNELNHQHSSALEWTIIWLIVIEVVIVLMKDVLHLI